MTATRCEAQPLAVNDAQGQMGFYRLPGLAAAPVFAIMSLLTGFSNQVGMAICGSGGMGGLNLGGMAVMYGLMTVVHAGPWLRLSQRRWRAGRTRQRA